MTDYVLVKLYVPSSIVITSLGEVGADLFAGWPISHILQFLVFLSLLLGRAAVSNCGTHW